MEICAVKNGSLKIEIENEMRYTFITKTAGGLLDQGNLIARYALRKS